MERTTGEELLMLLMLVGAIVVMLTLFSSTDYANIGYTIAKSAVLLMGTILFIGDIIIDRLEELRK